MNSELNFNFKGDDNEIYNLLIENNFDENYFEIVKESYDDNIWQTYSINYNNNFYDENDFYNLLKNKFNDNIIFFL